jgi:hypothetical protein
MFYAPFIFFTEGNMATKDITWGGIGLRFLVAIIMVVLTYNPEGYSYYHWVKNQEAGQMVLKVFCGVVLVIGWTVYLRAMSRSLGGFGILLAAAFFASLLWVLVEWGWIPTDSVRAVTYMIMFVIAALLATGMVWSHLRRRMTGQMDVDEIEQ